MDEIIFVLSNEQTHFAYMAEYKTRVEAEPYTLIDNLFKESVDLINQSLYNTN